MAPTVDSQVRVYSIKQSCHGIMFPWLLARAGDHWGVAGRSRAKIACLIHHTQRGVNTGSSSVCVGDKDSGNTQWRIEGLQRPGAKACMGAPPPELAPPPPPLFFLKRSSTRKTEKTDPLTHRERGARSICYFCYYVNPALKWSHFTYLPRPNFLCKISPYKLGGRPLQGLRPGAMPPAPPPRHATGNTTRRPPSGGGGRGKLWR